MGTPLHRASNLKEEAKKAFMDRNYSQASADYTQAILALNSESPEHRDMLCVLLSNRAACELKLGRLETALADAEEGQVTGHGRGDHSEYYQKWDQIAADALNGVEAEEEQEKKQSDAALGLTDAPLSEAEKLDREKSEALKRAKKHWDGMQGQK